MALRLRALDLLRSVPVRTLTDEVSSYIELRRGVCMTAVAATHSCFASQRSPALCIESCLKTIILEVFGRHVVFPEAEACRLGLAN